MRQDGSVLWWVGLSESGGFTFTNVFKGEVSDYSITGNWADVPHGRTANSGQLSLEIVLDPSGNPTQLMKRAYTGNFGGWFWSRVLIRPPAGQRDLRTVFDNVKKNQNAVRDHSLLDNLKPYKDHAVVFGRVVKSEAGLPLHVNYRSGDGRSYKDFICLDNNNSPPDGDLNLDIITDRVEPLNTFWTEGWEPNRNPNDFRAKLDKGARKLHLEIIMFGRVAECGDEGRYGLGAWLPGWQEQATSSVLLNGTPINGQVNIGGPAEYKVVGIVSAGDGTIDVRRSHAPTYIVQSSRVNSILSRQIQIGDYVRVIGVLSLDCGHGITHPCNEDQPDEQNQEMHPVYSLDIVDRSSKNDLTGVWADGNGRTYYLHQVGNVVWGFGVGSFRDPDFGRVFLGTTQSDPLNGDTIQGMWQDVPLGIGQSKGYVRLDSATDPSKRTLVATFGLGVLENQRWMRLYDTPAIDCRFVNTGGCGVDQ